MVKFKMLIIFNFEYFLLYFYALFIIVITGKNIIYISSK